MEILFLDLETKAMAWSQIDLFYSRQLSKHIWQGSVPWVVSVLQTWHCECWIVVTMPKWSIVNVMCYTCAPPVVTNHSPCNEKDQRKRISVECPQTDCRNTFSGTIYNTMDFLLTISHLYKKSDMLSQDRSISLNLTHKHW